MAVLHPGPRFFGFVKCESNIHGSIHVRLQDIQVKVLHPTSSDHFYEQEEVILAKIGLIFLYWLCINLGRPRGRHASKYLCESHHNR